MTCGDVVYAHQLEWLGLAYVASVLIPLAATTFLGFVACDAAAPRGARPVVVGARPAVTFVPLSRGRSETPELVNTGRTHGRYFCFLSRAPERLNTAHGRELFSAAAAASPGADSRSTRRRASALDTA